jgi:hypothetical protein
MDPSLMEATIKQINEQAAAEGKGTLPVQNDPAAIPLDPY